MGLSSYSELTSLHRAFIKLPLSKFVAPESRGCLLQSQIHRETHPTLPAPFRYGESNGAHIFATNLRRKDRNRRDGDTR